MMNFTYVKTNQEALDALLSEFPEESWNCSIIDEIEGELDVTFQHWNTDSEYRYVIRNGYSTQI